MGKPLILSNLSEIPPFPPQTTPISQPTLTSSEDFLMPLEAIMMYSQDDVMALEDVMMG